MKNYNSSLALIGLGAKNNRHLRIPSYTPIPNLAESTYTTWPGLAEIKITHEIRSTSLGDPQAKAKVHWSDLPRRSRIARPYAGVRP
jgi:hypothetical protein